MKRISVWVVFVLAGSLFLAASLLVALNRRSTLLTGWKFRLGSILVSLTTLVGCKPGGPLGVTCYDPMLENYVSIDYQSIDSIPAQQSIKIVGQIQNPSVKAFTYALTDSSETLQQGEVLPSDGALDESYEDFSITLEPLEAGGYTLLFYVKQPDNTLQVMNEYPVVVLQ